MAVPPTLRELLAQIEQGRYALPEIQRPFVWRNAQVRDLLDSIYRGYPIGSIIVWSPQKSLLSKYSDLFRPLVKDLEDKKENIEFLVIDGQQRLVSLLLAKKGSVTIYHEYTERRRYLPLYFNPDKDTLKVLTKKREQEEGYWFKVSDLLDEKKIIEHLLDEKDITSRSERDRLLERLNTFRNAVLNYPVNVYQIPQSALKYDSSEDNFLEIFEKISEMFIRLNEKGTRVKMPHLILALLTATTRKELGKSFRECMSKINDTLSSLGWDIREGVIMRTYMAIATGETNFRRARDKLGELEAEKALKCLNDAGRALESACKILSDEFNIKSAKYLKSQYLLVTLSYYIFSRNFDITLSDVKQLRRWLILASFDGRYTGRLESDLREDIELIRNKRPLKDLESKLTIREVTEAHFDEQYGKEHLTALLILLRDSYDLCRGIRRLKNLEPDKMQIHHIFPKNLLLKVYGKEAQIGGMDIEAAYDHVANITIISEDTNRRIRDKRPDEYLKDLDSEVLKSHYIPEDPGLWKPDRYYDFLQERKKLLVRKLNDILSI